MKKSTTFKLKLNNESVRALTPDKLANVGGGLSLQFCTIGPCLPTFAPSCLCRRPA